MTKTLIALDIDETLNSMLDHQLLCNADIEGGDERLYPYQFEDTLKFCNITNGGNRSEYDLGMYVNVGQLKAFNNLRSMFDADILGTSSWFGGGRESRNIASFLEIPEDKFIGAGNTCGSVGRCKSVAEEVLKGGYNRLIVLDDQYFGWDIFGLELHRPDINGLEGFNSYCQQQAIEIQKIELDYERIGKLLSEYTKKEG